MKDVTTILQKKLYDILKPVLSCPVYYKYLPATIEPNEYVLINTITNIDAGTIHSSDTDTTIIIGIYTKDSQANPGKTANDIAALVYSNLYPNQQFRPDLEPDFQVCSVALVNDVVPDPLMTRNYIFINRFITFRYNIYHL
jgi:hypothetical protein